MMKNNYKLSTLYRDKSDALIATRDLRYICFHNNFIPVLGPSIFIVLIIKACVSES